jgi:hypothetical protein
VSKKWYSFFVVTDDKAEATKAPVSTGTPSAAADDQMGRPSPVRAIDVVTDSGSSAVFPDASSSHVDLGLVYSSAQITEPPHGYTVLKIAEMLRSEHIRALPVDVKRKSILVALDAAGVKVTDIVEDAVRRDRALDTYERVLQKHVEDLRAQIETENKQIDDEIARRVAELRGRIDANTQKLAAESRELEVWRARKHQEETTIADAVGYFVSENPITAPARPADGDPKGDADVR